MTADSRPAGCLVPNGLLETEGFTSLCRYEVFLSGVCERDASRVVCPLIAITAQAVSGQSLTGTCETCGLDYQITTTNPPRKY